MHTHPTNITITETHDYTIIKVPKHTESPQPVRDVRFDAFVGMLEKDGNQGIETPVEAEDNAYELWRTTVD